MLAVWIIRTDALQRDSATPKSLRNSPSTGIITVNPDSGGQSTSTHGLTPSPPSGSTATPVGNAGGLLNGISADANANNNNSATNNANNNSGGNSMFATGDVLADSGLFGSDTDLDWMNSLTGGSDGIDFALYLENIGEDNEGEVGIA